jgi:hypothetical protein
VGIDPGKGGALVALLEYTDGLPPVVIRHSMPLIGTKRPTVDLVELYAILTGYQELRAPRIHCYVEKQQPLPPTHGGTAANFARGYNMGILEGILVAISMPYTVVAPRRWQTAMLADVEGTDTKARALRAVRRLYPKQDLRRSELAKKPDSGVVDALLIADWGRRQ